MADKMRIENDPSINVNTPEAKVAKEMAQQFISKRSGRITKHTTMRKEAEVMLNAVNDLEPRQGEPLKALVKTLDFTEDNGLNKFLKMSDQVFNGNMSWGRIITLCLFAAMTVDHMKKNGKESTADKVGLWLGICIARQSTWIRENNGWQGFINTCGGIKEMKETFFNGLLNVTMGLGTIAAAIYINGK